MKKFQMKRTLKRLFKSDDIIVADFEGLTFTGLVMLYWKKRRSCMLHPYARVDYALSPHPRVQEHAKKHLIAEDRSAISTSVASY